MAPGVKSESIRMASIKAQFEVPKETLVGFSMIRQAWDSTSSNAWRASACDLSPSRGLDEL